MNESDSIEQLTELANKLEQNPIAFVEEMINRKLSFCEKLIFSIQWKFYKGYNKVNNILKCYRLIRNKVK